MPTVSTIRKINRDSFFKKIRESFFNGKLSQGQVDGVNAIFNEWEKRKADDLRHLSYMLATVYHETAKTMQPINEYGKGEGKKYGSKIKMSGKAYSKPDKIYFGRGFVQLTWYENYETMAKLLGVDLLNAPEKALELNIATQILFEGMRLGTFTGKKLSDYFSDKKDDPKNARRIINGTDKAELIAIYHQKFYVALL